MNWYNIIIFLHSTLITKEVCSFGIINLVKNKYVFSYFVNTVDWFNYSRKEKKKKTNDKKLFSIFIFFKTIK
jgi:hypothetical protein